jgi:hypothetical protein
MTLALVYKEFRENGPIAAVGLLALLIVAASSMGFSPLPFWPGLFGYYRQGTIPFVSDSFGSQLVFVAGALALAIAYRQSLGDFWGEAQYFLFHRPISRSRVYVTKLLVGLAIYLFCASLPVIIYAIWAASPGTHASPFDWSMTVGAWKSWLVMTTLYLGAFLSGIRPAGWFGTRLAPVMAAAVLALLFSFCGFAVALALVVVANIVFVRVILDVADSRDFA